MCGEQGFIAVHETVHLVKFIGKGCSIFFSSAYFTLLGTTGYKVLKYSSQIHIWSTWPHNNRTNSYNFRFVLMLVCFSPQIFDLSQACEKHIQTRLAISVLEYYIANNVMSCFSAQLCYDTELGIRFQQPSLIESLYFLILTIYLSYWTRFCSLQQQCLFYIEIMLKKTF